MLQEWGLGSSARQWLPFCDPIYIQMGASCDIGDENGINGSAGKRKPLGMKKGGHGRFLDPRARSMFSSFR